MARFELTAHPACRVAPALRFLLALGGAPFADAPDAAAAPSFPSLADDAARLVIDEPLAAARHAAAATGTLRLGGAPDAAARDAVRGDALAAIALGALRADALPWRARADAATRGPLARGSDGGVTFGDVLLWFVVATGGAAGEGDDAPAAARLGAWAAALGAATPALAAAAARAGSAAAVILRAAPAAAPVDVIAVTGAASFIGSWVVKILLERGARVRGTVRSLARASAWGHLAELPGAGAPTRAADGSIVCGALTLYEADACGGDEARARAALRAAFCGARAVVHTASPYDLAAAEQDAPAIAGTTAALLAAADELSVARVVLTSSAAAVYVAARPADAVYCADDWSEAAALAAPGFAYHAAKTRAEAAAWALVEDGGRAAAARDAAGAPRLTLAALCPTQTIGPMLGARLNTSSALLLAYADGSKARIPRKGKAFVDVRDVAAAHVLAIDSDARLPPRARERYLLVAGNLPWAAVCARLRAALPRARVPTEVEDGPPAAPQAYCDTSAAWRLGVRFRPIEESIDDAALSFVEAGHLNDN
jgi:cinnamoyl-CoA reductase